MNGQPRTAVRAPVMSPAPDESLSSIFDRAALFWDLPREALLACVLPHDANAASALEADAALPGLVDVLSDIVGVPTSRLAQAAMGEDDTLLAAGTRVAYCPLCWRDDAHAQREPYFRRAWGAIDALLCTVHQIPLSAWGTNGAGRRFAPPSIECPRRTTDALWQSEARRAQQWLEDTHAAALSELVVRLQGFAAGALASLRNPNGATEWWPGGTSAFRQLATLLVTNPAPYGEFAPMDRLVPDVHVGYLFAGQRWRCAPNTTPLGWSAVRELGHPAWRRTFFWLIARTLKAGWHDLPLRGWSGHCAGREAWWCKRLRVACSGYAQPLLRELESLLDLDLCGETPDLFAA